MGAASPAGPVCVSVPVDSLQSPVVSPSAPPAGPTNCSADEPGRRTTHTRFSITHQLTLSSPETHISDGHQFHVCVPNEDVVQDVFGLAWRKEWRQRDPVSLAPLEEKKIHLPVAPGLRELYRCTQCGFSSTLALKLCVDHEAVGAVTNFTWTELGWRFPSASGLCAGLG